ncbi:MAG: Fic family protein, partial [Erysipelotrichaceae bacterium]
HERGFAGCWKKIPNEISGRNLKLAQPYEVDEKIDNLLEKWNQSDKNLELIAWFHAKFEQIHPFQDGNGRVGRFIMLKQCIENDVDLILIDDKFSKEYKEAIYKAQSQNNISELLNVFTSCHELLDSKLSFLKETIEYINKHDVEINEKSI